MRTTVPFSILYTIIFKEQRKRLRDREVVMEYYPYPKFVLGGHQTEVS